MAIPKKGRMKIVVENEVYYFRDSTDRGVSPKYQVLTLVGEEENNQKLIFEYPHLQTYKVIVNKQIVEVERYGGYSFVPKPFIEQVIKYYTKENIWHPLTKGKTIYAHIHQENDICYFKNGRITEADHTENISSWWKRHLTRRSS